LALAVVAYLITWHIVATQTPLRIGNWITDGWGLGLAAAILLFALTWLQKKPRKWSPPRHASLVRAGLVCLLGVVLAVPAIWLLWSGFASHGIRDMIEAPLLALALAYWIAIIVAPLLFWATRGVRALNTARHRAPPPPDAPPQFSTGLSMAPALLLSAILLALVVGPAVRLRERQAAVAMNATRASFSLAHELEKSRYEAARQVLLDR